MGWILYLGNHRQVLYRGGLRSVCPVWEGDGPPEARPRQWRPVRRLRVLVDLIEEEFRLERLPHLSGADHRALVARRRRQLFQDAGLVRVERLGRERHGRRDDRVLFGAVRASAVLDRWSQALAAWGVGIAGYWSLPRLAECLLPSWGDGLRLLLYSQGGRLVLRQNYREGRRLVFSRLSLMEREAAEEEAPEEVERTWRYLQRTFGVSGERRLQVVAAEALARPLANVLAELPDTRVAVLPAAGEIPREAALHLARRCWCRPHYRSPRPARARGASLLYAAAVAGIAVAGAYLAYAWQRHGELEQTHRELADARDRLQRQLAALPAPGAVDGFTPWQVEAWMEVHRTLNRRRLVPETLLTPLGRVLARFPAWRLVELSWERPAAGEEGESSFLPPRPPVVLLTLRREGVTDVRRLAADLGRLRRAFTAEAAIRRTEVVSGDPPLDERTPLKGKVSAGTEPEMSATFKLKIWFAAADEEG